MNLPAYKRLECIIATTTYGEALSEAIGIKKENSEGWNFFYSFGDFYKLYFFFRNDFLNFNVLMKYYTLKSFK
jgi:hypothetical protein